MKTVNYINDKKLEQFISEITSHNDYRTLIQNSYVIGITGDSNIPFVFGFIEQTKLPQEVEKFCNEKFHEYFPTCKLLDKLS